ncbi:hypothetical protein LSTR_LSTR008642 [Laodelphax striatellus]|uniref:Uncharacterized protein n=1 Tax=Laodelphax striatellus TaxID=195883 RepID=A0A482WM46_LAOST|nr:hypothetical protein LSTR_LSTR008642 [Laodelphax striatellus]
MSENCSPDGGRKSSLKSTPPRSQSSLHVHFPPESTMISVTMIPPPPEKMTALRSLKKVLFCCCSAGGAVEGGVEGGEEGENAVAATS